MAVSPLLNDLGNVLTDRATAGRKLHPVRSENDFGSTLSETRQSDARQEIGRNRDILEKRSDELRARSGPSHKDDPAPVRKNDTSAQEKRRNEAREQGSDDNRAAKSPDVPRSRQADDTERTDARNEKNEIAAETSGQSEKPTADSVKLENEPAKTGAEETKPAGTALELTATLLTELNPAQAAAATPTAIPVEIQLAALLDTSKPLSAENTDKPTLAEETATDPSGSAETAQINAAAATVLSIKVENKPVADTAASDTASSAAQAITSKTAGKTKNLEVSGNSKDSASEATAGKGFEQALSTNSQKNEKTAVQSVTVEAVTQIATDKASGPAATEPSVTAIRTTEPVEQTRPTTQTAALTRADTPVPLQAVAVEIGMRAMRGSKEFSIRLDPEDLGRIDIRLEISEAGEIQAKLTVDRVETMQLLQRDAKTLEQAFDQAGLKSNPDGLQFSLRDPGKQRDGEQQHRHDQHTARGESLPVSEEIAMKSFHYTSSASGGLDIRI